MCLTSCVRDSWTLDASAIDLVNSIGRRLRDLSDDSRELVFCFNDYLLVFSVSSP
jgi:hypothetical protein